jgi:hypothetical protein
MLYSYFPIRATFSAHAFLFNYVIKILVGKEYVQIMQLYRL